MSNEEKHDLAYYQAHPERYKIASNGTVVDLELARSGKGGFVAMFPEMNPHAITKENAHAMNARRRAKKLRAEMKGDIDVMRLELGWKVPDPDTLTDEEIIAIAEDFAPRMYRAKLGSDYMSSKGLRDKPASFEKLMGTYGGSDGEKRGVTIENMNMPPMPPAMLVELVDLLEQRQRLAVDKARAEDADEIGPEKPSV